MAIPRFPGERPGRLPQRYFLALGHLQYAYTTLECAMAAHINLLVTAGYDPKEHRFILERISAVSGGLRLDGIKDTLKRLLRVMEAPQDITDYVSALFSQLSEIQFFRNRLTHYHTGRSWRGPRTRFINSDIELAREYAKAITFSFSYDALDAARHDLHAIGHYLDLALPDGEPYVLTEPVWQYKPAMLTR